VLGQFPARRSDSTQVETWCFSSGMTRRSRCKARDGAGPMSQSTILGRRFRRVCEGGYTPH
jgi:hypothetical protein